jgi:hypothetical protein
MYTHGTDTYLWDKNYDITAEVQSFVPLACGTSFYNKIDVWPPMQGSISVFTQQVKSNWW